METKHNYTAFIAEINPDLFVGIVMEIPGAMSFAKSKEGLKERLKDAAKCMQETNKSDIKSIFKDNFGHLGILKTSEELISCSL